MSNPPSIPPIAAGTLPAPAARRWWPTVLLACAVFFAGAGFGTAATVIVAVHRVRMALQHPQQVPIRLARELKRRLGLNEEQTLAVQGILAARQKRMQNMRLQEWDAARAEISNVLEPEQKGKWNSTFEELQAALAPADE